MRLFMLFCFFSCLMMGFARAQSPALHSLRLTTENASQKPEPEGGEAVRVWERYRALAAGQPESVKETEQGREAEAIRDNHDSTENELLRNKAPRNDANRMQMRMGGPAPDANDAPAATGFATVLQQYSKNKTQRSQMHTITVNTPQDFEAKHTENAKPDADPDKP